ncbi:hypothetical protein NDU88_000697 [Pleurodeles waltl]|uniref:Uncharacterized protein n=1 Tax=Pleurodeles waltl TaxID=8319 RepID=A0AAV7USL3_PLEWA|nr:hypothetical protein NDU88_000697 [Pleurodeles waltl]
MRPSWLKTPLVQESLCGGQAGSLPLCSTFTFPFHLSLRHTGVSFNYGVSGVPGISGSRLRQRTVLMLRCAASKLHLPPPGWAKDVTRVRLSQLSHFRLSVRLRLSVRHLGALQYSPETSCKIVPTCSKLYTITTTRGIPVKPTDKDLDEDDDHLPVLHPADRSRAADGR